MDDEKLFYTLNELVKISDPDKPGFDNGLNILAREALWNDATKDVRDKLSNLIIVYTNILVDKGLIEKDSKIVVADRILSNIHCMVTDNLTKVFNPVEEYCDPLEANHIGINSEFFE